MSHPARTRATYADLVVLRDRGEAVELIDGEILSTSTARYDLVKKQRTLHQHGVPHSWLADPERQTLMVLRHAEGGYLNVLNAAVGDVVRAEPFDAIEIDVADLFGVEP